VDGVKPALAAAEAAGDEAAMLYLRHLALFLTTFLGEHGTLLETEGYKEALRSGLDYLVQASDVGDAEIFKICVEFWLRCAASLYDTETMYNPALPSLAAVVASGGPGGSSLDAAAPATISPMPMPPLSGDVAAAGPGGNPRKPLYAEVLCRVREVMIRHMARPEEVLIEKDDSGEYVREQQKDTDAIALYKVMRDTLVFLTHLDPRNTEELMLEKLTKQVNGEEWGYDVLNTLCWAIGSISGTMAELDEKNFLVTVIKDLLLLCETKRGKSNKAVIASNIMCAGAAPAPRAARGILLFPRAHPPLSFFPPRTPPGTSSASTRASCARTGSFCARWSSSCLSSCTKSTRACRTWPWTRSLKSRRRRGGGSCRCRRARRARLSRTCACSCRRLCRTSSRTRCTPFTRRRATWWARTPPRPRARRARSG
jgi:hypothetical protein